jgi:tripartite-type tricarboxylate transporter receptor subunit TctC
LITSRAVFWRSALFELDQTKKWVDAPRLRPRRERATMQMIPRIGALLVAFVGLIVGTARAEQVFPSRPITIVVPYAPSGAPDVISRLLARRMSNTLGVTVIVENRPGGTGIPANTLVAKSNPDGYTILAVDGNTFGIVPAMNKSLPYDPVNDFVPLVQSVIVPMFLVVNAKVPAKTVSELINYLKEHPDTNYASAGLASIHQLVMEQFLHSTGLTAMHIPYRGVLQAVPALLTGDAKLMFNSLPSISSHVEVGTLRLLAVAAAERSALRPNIPTLAEGGVSGKSPIFTMGYAVPRGTPDAIHKRLEQVMLEALHDKEITEQLPRLGLELLGKSSAAYRNTILEERRTYEAAVQAIKMKLN